MKTAIIWRVQISCWYFAKFESILSFCDALSLKNNKNAKLVILFLAPKFHLVTIIFKQGNVLQKHLISWHYLILQSLRQTNFLTVCPISFMFWILYISRSQLFQRCFYQCQISKFLQGRIWILLIFMVQFCFATQFDV